jgi:hypothetical protein
MAKTAQISKEKRQSIITLKEMSIAVAKTIKRYDEIGSHEDHHRKGRPSVISSAEDKLNRVNCTSDCSPNKFFRVHVTDTSTSTV